MKIIGYTYRGDTHCPFCTFNEAAVGLLHRQSPLQVCQDEWGLTQDLVDHGRNRVRPIYDIDEGAEAAYCGDCFDKLVR